MREARKGKPAQSAADNAPKAVVNRLSLYLRELQRLVANGQETTNSTQLGSLLGLTDAQVRKDLAHFGQFGYPGIGYRCSELIAVIRRILGTDQAWPVAVVGIGNLGRALIGYRGFGNQNFRIIAGFDVDADKVGRIIEGIPVHHLDRLAEIAPQENIRLAILAVPASAAQAVAEQVVDAGIEGVLNFAPVTLNLPPTVHSVRVDLAMELEQLSFAVVNKAAKP